MKPIEFCGGALDDLREFPDTARRQAGYQLDKVQHGLAPDLVGGCLPISGIMDLHDPQPAPGSLEERVYTTVLRGLPAEQDVVFSPLYWTAGNTLPFDLSFGEHDSARVQRSNRRLLPLLNCRSSRILERPNFARSVRQHRLQRWFQPMIRRWSLCLIQRTRQSHCCSTTR